MKMDFRVIYVVGVMTEDGEWHPKMMFASEKAAEAYASALRPAYYRDSYNSVQILKDCLWDFE